MKKILLAGLTAAVVAGLGAPAAVSAQGSDDLASSLTPTCLDPACNTVSFLLDIQGVVQPSNLVLQSLAPTLWKFGSLLGVFDAAGNDLTQFPFLFWTLGAVNGEQLILNANGAPVVNDPLRFDVAMLPQTAGLTREDMAGVIAYESGGECPGCTTGYYSAAGTVTPEPSTVILLGTGLLGLAGVAYRRRREDELA